MAVWVSQVVESSK